MSLVDVRQYFRTRLESLGFAEWRSEFNVESIPRTLLTRSYHVESGIISPTESNHQVHEFNCAVTIRVFFKGYLDPASAIDAAYVSAEAILAEVLSPTNRLGTAVHNVSPRSLLVNPLSDQNDNSVILEIEFEAKTFMNF